MGDAPTVEEVRAEVEAWLDENWDEGLTVGEWWDRLEVRVNNNVLDRYGDPEYGEPDFPPFSCDDLYDTGWVSEEFNLKAYAGKTVLLTFFNENHADRYWNTYSYLDNIRIEVEP